MTTHIALNDARQIWPYASPSEYAELFSGVSTLAMYPLDQTFALPQRSAARVISLFNSGDIEAIFENHCVNTPSPGQAKSVLDEVCSKLPMVEIAGYMKTSEKRLDTSTAFNTPTVTPQKRGMNEVGLYASAQHKRQRPSTVQTPLRAQTRDPNTPANLTAGNTSMLSMDDSFSTFSPALGILRMVDASLVETPIKEVYSPRVIAATPGPSPRTVPCRAYAYDSDGREHVFASKKTWPQFWPARTACASKTGALFNGPSHTVPPARHNPEEAPRFSLWHR